MKNEQNISVYEQSVHVYGRIWTGMALILMILSPVAICCYYNAWPPLTAVLKSLLGVAPMYWTVGIIEVFTFVPMLGTGGSYLGFVTGNLTNLKVPCALNAMEAAKAPARQRGGRGYLHHRHRFQLDRDHAGHRPGRVRTGVPAPGAGVACAQACL